MDMKLKINGCHLPTLSYVPWYLECELPPLIKIVKSTTAECFYHNLSNILDDSLFSVEFINTER